MLQKHRFVWWHGRASKSPTENAAQLPFAAAEPRPGSAPCPCPGPRAVGSGLAPGPAPAERGTNSPGPGRWLPPGRGAPLFWERAPLRLQQQQPGNRADGLLPAARIIASAGYSCSQPSLLFVPL